ncbi:MAG TPA: hypothetical protein VHY91_16050 [Pirellulales bacterium]|jgi:hypothetical protein|nr:hypothetical protein [Pirellulales bacterium]
MQSSPRTNACRFFLTLAALVCLAMPAAAEDRSVSLVDGKLQLTAPETWERKKPQNNVIQYEFAVAPVGGDERPGRVTISGAGGSVDANIDRWLGQFIQPDGADSKKAAKIEEKKIAGQTVHLVDISGTYKDQPGGPFAGGPIVERKKYRMFAAIIVTKDLGNYFLKFYGPEQTVADNRAAFDKMVESLETK